VVQYHYKTTAGTALMPLPDRSKVTAEAATTVTTASVTGNFIVRVETGSMERGIYQNAILHDPTVDPTPSPFTPPKGWNKKLIAVHGSGCVGGWYIQGPAMGVNPYTSTNMIRLGEGYAVFVNTLNHPTNSCNAVVAGEVTMMGKEHFIETFGVPTATSSTGGSGGAYTSLQVADIYPGLIDGVFISATFPDALSISMASLAQGVNPLKALHPDIGVDANLNLGLKTQLRAGETAALPSLYHPAEVYTRHDR